MFAVREEIDQAHALSASLADVHRQGHISVINQQLAQHPMMKSESLATASSEPSTKYQGRPEDFPTLDGAPQSVLSAAEEAQPKPSVVENPDAGSRPPPPPEMSLAKKLAMSSRLSVRNGPVDMADFPSLPGTRQTKTRKVPLMPGEDFPTLSGASQAKLSKTSKPSVWIACSKGSADPAQPAGRSEKSGHKNNDIDFPDLSAASTSDRNASLPTNPLSRDSLASISRNFSSGSLSKISDQVETASAPSSLSWGPELNQKSENQKERKEPKDNLLHLKPHKNSCRSTVHEAWGANNGRIADSELSSHEKQAATDSNISDKSSALPTKTSAMPSETATRNTVEDTGDAPTASSPDWIQVGCEKKTEFRPSKKNDAKMSSNKASYVQTESKKSAKSNGKTDDSNSKLKNVKDKSKKKQKANKTQKEPIAAAASSEDAEKQSAKTSVVVDGQKSELEKSDDVTSDERELSKAAETLVDCDSVQKQDASEGGCDGNTVNIAAIELVTVAEANPVVGVTQSLDVEAATPVFTADDFPHLFVKHSAPSSLPPGFSSLTVTSSKLPPPGFANPEVPRCPPPGLNSVFPSLQADDTHKMGEVDLAVHSYAFIPPQDMLQRTASFVSFISTAVKDGSFAEFHDLSAKFRAGNISADEYHSGCYDMMDSESFLSIFPELITLLPDLPKQQQLLKVHRDFLSRNKTRYAEKSRPWCSSPEDGLVSCTVCGQVLHHSDLQHHASEHRTFNTDYPTLPSSSICSVR